MTVTATELIESPRHRVWEIITDIDNAATTISAITDLKIVERPKQGIIGLKWEETRMMFGKSATETLWISAAKEFEWYETTAKNCGAIYNSKLSLVDKNGGTELSMSFSATPVTFAARLMSWLGFLFNGTIRKAFQQDLLDIKRRAEG